ncbi:MAG TPA: hypothetical protein VHY21_21430 [Pseudonocardiaceae bacterium]|nr:hypothetical protein [Pseudonocardiaceae bacterium]
MALIVGGVRWTDGALINSAQLRDAAGVAMHWIYEKAEERAAARYAQTEDLVIADITKEIDFDLISRTRPRRVIGTHFYVDVANFTKQLRGELEDDGEDLLRLLHVYSREVSRIVASDFDGQKVHFQGPRLHALAYRPVSDESEMAAKAVLTCLAIRYMTSIFNEVFELVDDAAWLVAAGLDHGRCVATKNGANGDQELLFLGSAANHAAKILDKAGTRMTSRVRDLLPEGFDSAITDIEDGDSRIWMPLEDVERLAVDHGWAWTAAASRIRLGTAAAKYPAGSVTSSEVGESIDKSALTLSRTKRVFGASLFADVDGFTSYIDGLEQIDENLVEAIRTFHVLRGVMRDSAVQDFNALRIQYQGDRMQALVYRPVADGEKAAFAAVKLAAALITVANEIVPAAVSTTEVHPLAIGLAWGQVLVSRIGEHGNTDVISLGSSTAKAADIQQHLDGNTVGIDGTLRDLLPEWLQQAFKWSASAGGYVATDLDWHTFCLLEASEEDGVRETAPSESARAQSPIRPWRGV